MKLMIVGSCRSGKDHASEYLRDNFGLSYKGSSILCAELFIFDELKDKYSYKTIEECFEDRVNHRSEWFDLISEKNSEDLTSLAEIIFSKSQCYTGIRRKEELQASKDKWNELLVIWIDAEGRVEEEDSSSCTIQKHQADIIIENKTSLRDFNQKLDKLGKLLFPKAK